MERFDLGGHTRKVTTKSDDAQRLFNLGLNWCFGFNQEEGVACFQRVLEFDLFLDYLGQGPIRRSLGGNGTYCYLVKTAPNTKISDGTILFR